MNTQNENQRGFTLIELLVVVAIIGVLATVVLASLNSARNKSKDAAIKQSLSQFQRQAALHYLDYGNYNLLCDPESVSGKIFADAYSRAAILGPGNNLCMDIDGTYLATPPGTLAPTSQGSGADVNGNVWAVALTLSTGQWICIDSSGNTTISPTRTIQHVPSPIDKTCN